MLWESAPKPAVADRLKQQLGLVSVEFSPCEAAAGADYLEIMHKNIANITPVLRSRVPLHCLSPWRMMWMM